MARVVLPKEEMQKRIDKSVEYYTHDGRLRTAIVKDVEYHYGLDEHIYICKSPFGRTLRLTHTELHLPKAQ